MKGIPSNTKKSKIPPTNTKNNYILEANNNNNNNSIPGSYTSSLLYPTNLNPPVSYNNNNNNNNNNRTPPNNNNNKQINEIIKKYENDINILQYRISDLQGIQRQENNNESYFVNTLRSSIEGNRGNDNNSSSSSSSSNYNNNNNSNNNNSDLRIEMLEQLIEKITELDRAILKKTEITSARVRRGSRGADLFSFPTHLLLVDRLLDLHTISQRSVILRSQSSIVDDSNNNNNNNNTVTPTPPVVQDNTELIKAHENEIKVITKRLNDSETSCQQLRNQTQKQSKEIEELKSEIITLSTKKPQKSPRHTIPPSQTNSLYIVGNNNGIESSTTSTSTTTQLQPQAPITNLPSALTMKYEAEITELKCRLQVSESKNRQLEEKIDYSVAESQQVITGLLKCKQLIQDQNPINSFQGINGMSDEVKKQFNELYSTLTDYISKNNTKITELIDEKMSVSHELMKVQQKEHEMIQQVQNERQEFIKSQYLKQQELEESLNKMTELCKGYKKELEDLSRQQADSKSQLLICEKQAKKIEELQSQLLEMEDRRYALERSNNEIQSEMISVRTLNESLMKKLRDLSNKENKREFTDTFEEVMREEMMAMKTAFELKLKIATEERDVATRRHQTELQRLQNRIKTLGEP